MRKVFCLVVLVFLTVQTVDSQVIIHPSEPVFTYSGRFDQSSADEVRFDWPGTSIYFQFKGSFLKLALEGGKRNYFNVFIDGKLHEVVYLPSDTIYEIKKIRGGGWHSFRLQKRTEGEMGTSNFKGVVVKKKEHIKRYGSLPVRKIEFIGNSITCGYGAEGASKDEDFLPETENVDKSYASIIARAFIAECYITAHSGLGVVRNYGDKDEISTKLATLPKRYNQVLDMDTTQLWNFNSWQPDVLVINLGTNDYSTNVTPDRIVFQRYYSEFIKKLREYYGDIPVFCINGPMREDPTHLYIKELVQSIRLINNDRNIYFLNIPQILLNVDSDLGSDWHPSYRGQLKMALHLLPSMANVLQWDYTDNELMK